VLRFIFSFFGSIFALLTLGGVLGAALLAGIFLAYGADLPDHEQLASYEPATISRVYSSDGKVMDEFAQERRLFTPADEIPDIVKQAFISAEDKNFYNHPGYDLAGIASAVMDKAKGKKLRGASTIPQQVAKNFLLTNEISAERKIKEIILATRMVGTLGREKVLELYLNEIDLGVRSFGVTAAADSYFAKQLEELSIEEAAFLAVHPKSPYGYNPAKDYDKAMFRRNDILREMNENGYISDVQYVTAKEAPIHSVQTGEIKPTRSKRPPRNYFTDEIRRQLSASFGEDEFFTAGLAVRATMDPGLQSEAEKALRDGLERFDRANSPWRGPIHTLDTALLNDGAWREVLSAVALPRDIAGWHLAVVMEVGSKSARIEVEGFSPSEKQVLSLSQETKWAKNRQMQDGSRIRIGKATDIWSAGDVVLVKPIRDKKGNIERWSLRQIPKVQGGFMAMDTDTGRVLAMQGGFSYQHSVFNRATQAQRQPGSSFKPFVYAAALDSGYSPVSIIVDAPIEINTPQGLWRPKNASNRFYGPAPLRVGIEQSRNLMTIRLAQDVGMGVVGGYAERFGVYDHMNRVLSASLGAQETTLFKMVSSYAMFANGGERVQPTMVDRVQDRFGKTVFKHDQRDCVDCLADQIKEGRSPRIENNRERVMDPVTAYRLTSMMRGVVERGTARKVRMNGIQIAGKTGTTNDAKDVWFIGFTRNIVAGCYIGYDTPKSLGRGASGGGMCGPVFKQFMRKAIQTHGAGKFSQPDNTYFAKFDRFTGARLSDGATGDHVVSELFRIGDEPVLDGLIGIIDGGFSASADIEIFSGFAAGTTTQAADRVVITATGKKKKISGKASFGSLSSGGQY
jgi:penicillin-binding protein 1A